MKRFGGNHGNGRDNLVAHRFKPGQSGNPGGRPKGALNKLATDFLDALADDFAIHGRDAIAKMRTQHPDSYIRVVAWLIPRDFTAETPPLESLSDEELALAITELRAQLARAGDAPCLDAEVSSDPAPLRIASAPQATPSHDDATDPPHEPR
jgi:hypothetical protein